LAIEVQKLLTIGKYFFFPFFKSASCLTVIVLLFALYCECGKTPQAPPKTLKTDSRRPIPHHPSTKTGRGPLVPFFQKKENCKKLLSSKTICIKLQKSGHDDKRRDLKTLDSESQRR